MKQFSTGLFTFFCCALSLFGFLNKSKATEVSSNSDELPTGHISCVVVDTYGRETGFRFNFHYYSEVATMNLWKTHGTQDELLQSSFARIITSETDPFAKVASSAIGQPITGFVYRDNTNDYLKLNVRALLKTTDPCHNLTGELVITEVTAESLEPENQEERLISTQSLKCQKSLLHPIIERYLKRFSKKSLEFSFCN